VGELALEGIPDWLLGYNTDWDHMPGCTKKCLRKQARWDNYYLKKTEAWLKGKLPVEQQRLVYYRKFKRRMCDG
jgi:hypothetical protein